MRRIVRGAGVICGLAVSVSALASVALQGFSIVSTGGPLGNPGTSTGQPPVVMPAPTTVPVSLRGNSAASTNTLPSIPEAVEYDRLIRAHSEVGALDTGLLGESVDYFTGQTDFVATDVSLPGNNALAVAVGRRYHVTNHAGGLLIGAFGDWDLDIPHVEGIVATSVGWTVAGTTVDARCTYFGAPPSASTTTGTVSTSVPASEYSTGFAAVIPGSGRHELLLRAAATGAPIGPHPVTTKELWAVSCIQRGDVAPQPGAPDEGFVVTTPNGITYTFNQGWVRPYAPLTRPADTTTPGVVATVAREQIWLLPTKVEDRFHNQVTYSYESEALIGVALKHIDSSDGRHITLTWNGGQVQSVYDGTRTWSYQYPYGQNRLTQVKLPDASTWNFDLEDLDTTQWTYTSPTCTSLPSPSLNAPVSGTIQHPSGALGMFTFNVTRHGRSGAPTTCLSNSAHVNFAPTEPAVYDVLSLTEKKITGPNLGGALTWELAYDGCSSNSCNTTQTTTLTDARNYKTLYTFGSAYGTNGTGNEGMLLRKQTGGSGSTYTEDENYTYYDASGEPYPSVLGTPAQVRGDVSQLASLRPLQSRTLTLEGATYTQTLSDPDEYGFSKTITRAGTDTKTDTLVYAHDTTHWVLGTVKSLTSGSKTEFDLTLNSLNQPKEVRRFGRLDRSIDYYTDGAVHWIRDGASQQTTFRNFSLGIPKNIDYADNSGESVAVNALGQITSHNDPMGHITGFAYDLMGRLKKITPPAGYNPTTITWYPSSSGWSRNTTTGSASTDDTYDAFLHSVKTSDSAGRTVNRTFDADGRVTFESYPNDLISGITSTFDELGRLSSRTDGLGYATITTYDSTNGYPTIAVGDRNGHYTTTTFTTYDEPSAALPKFIAPPAGVGAGTAIQRDLWGKPTHIKRASISRDLTYYGDTQQLWKITEPETGTTTLTYDDAGNVQTVDHASAATETRTYDTRNRLKGITYSDASPSVGLTWRDDNQPDTATRGSTKRTYIYNTANLLTGESIAIDGTSYAIGYDYDLNRHLKTLTYPDTSSVAYAPDDFGRPSKVGSYATGVTYHPNGAIKAFNYGNGIAHSLTLDDRDLPWVATDTGILKVTHGYDHNGNPTNISGTQSRTLTYDTQDRLLTAAGPWGSSTLTCDDQDNLTGDTATALSLTIDPTSNLPTGGGLNWDSRGRLTHKGSGATAVNLTFNAADLLTGVTSASAIWTYGYDALGYRSTASSAGTTTTDVYDQGGRLLYETAVTSAVADRIFQNGFDPAVAATTATKYVYLGSHLVAKEQKTGTTTQTLYQHTDALGSPIAQTDATKAVVGTSTYLAYGGLHASTGTGNQVGPGYANQYADSTGLIYMHARYYDTQLHRFISADPNPVSTDNALNFNRYAYANNSPFKYYDPSGRESGCLYTDDGCGGDGGALLSEVVDKVLPPMMSELAPVEGAGAIAVEEVAAAAPAAIEEVGQLASAAANDVQSAIGLFEKAAASTIQANKTIGDTAADVLKNIFGGTREVSQDTSLGRRFIDNLTEAGVAQESKVGRTSLTSRVETQIEKDAELLNTPNNGINSVEWHFFPGKTGLGPTAPLQQKLLDCGITTCIHE